MGCYNPEKYFCIKVTKHGRCASFHRIHCLVLHPDVGEIAVFEEWRIQGNLRFAKSLACERGHDLRVLRSHPE